MFWKINFVGLLRVSLGLHKLALHLLHFCSFYWTPFRYISFFEISISNNYSNKNLNIIQSVTMRRVTRIVNRGDTKILRVPPVGEGGEVGGPPWIGGGASEGGFIIILSLLSSSIQISSFSLFNLFRLHQKT